MKNNKNSLEKELLAKYNFKMAKGLGQNFLVDKDILNQIVDAAQIVDTDCVLEIGPGIGVLTEELCKNAKSVIAVEIDKRLIPILNVTLFKYENLKIINEDILKVDLRSLLFENFGSNKAKIVANLPYYITTPIIMKLLEERFNIESIVVMVQKEVAERIVASPGGKDYGALSVAVQFYADASIIVNVPSDAFVPAPEVLSAVIRLDILDKKKVEVDDERLFFDVVKASFGQRRKTLLNALSGGNLNLSKEEIRSVLEECKIDEKRRGETLSLDEFANLANTILKFKNK